MEATLTRVEAGVFAVSNDAEAQCAEVIQKLATSTQRTLQVRALSLQARVLLEKARFQESSELLVHAIDICEEHLEPAALAVPHISLAFWHARHSDYRFASHYAERAREALGESATTRQKAQIKLMMARAALARGENAQGVHLLYEIQDLVRDRDLPDLAAETQLVLMRVAAQQGALKDVAEHATAAEHLIQAHHYGLLAPIHAYGVAMLAKNQGAPARELRQKLTRAVELATATHHRTLLVEAERWRGHILAWVDKDDLGAIAHYLRGLEQALLTEDRDSVGSFVAWAAETYQQVGDHAAAIGLMESHREVLETIQNARLRVQLDRSHCTSLEAVGRDKEALAIAMRGADRAQRLARHEYAAEVERYRHRAELDRRHEESRQAKLFWVVVSSLAMVLSALLLRLHLVQRRTNREQVALNSKLETALSQVQKLHGLLPICAQCKSVRDDDGYWHRIESYLMHNSKASLSHGICPGCATDLYPDLLPDLQGRADTKAQNHPDDSCQP